MNNVLIIYQSKYGSTKAYAGLLAEALKCDVIPANQCGKARLAPYDCIVFAGPLYAGGIAGIACLKKNWEAIRGKKAAVFCVGASPYEEKALEEMRKRSLKGVLTDIPLFYGRGAWDESKMSWKDRTLCKLLQKAVQKQPPSSYEPWQEALIQAMGKTCSWVDKRYLQPLLSYINSPE